MGGLVYEHVVPISLVMRRLLDSPPTTTKVQRRGLDATAERVIITTEGDLAIDAASARNTIPEAVEP